ncbi:MAG: hypothetical protein JO258_02720, partial [Alphaproteobacteria bacterium]|nr:hypothetical protein [Alphaproteobacteria bacterium]
MVSLFRKPTAEPVLDNRIADLARRRATSPASAISDDTAAVDGNAAAVDESPVPLRTVATLPPRPQPILSEPPPVPFDGEPEAGAPLAESVNAAPVPLPLSRPEPAAAPIDPPPAPIVVRPALDRSPPAVAPHADLSRSEPSPGASAAVPAAPSGAAASLEDKLTAARSHLIARLGGEIRPERRSLLSRGELAKLVDAAVQAHFVRNGINADPLARRDLVTAILQELLNPGTP